MAFMKSSFDFDDFPRFSYEKKLQNSDFFKDTFANISSLLSLMWIFAHKGSQNCNKLSLLLCLEGKEVLLRYTLQVAPFDL